VGEGDISEIAWDSNLLVVDTHMHQWDPLTTPRHVSGASKLINRFPLAEPVLRRLMPSGDINFIGDPRYVLRPYLVQDYVNDTLPEVQSVVHIEASWTGGGPTGSVDETVWLQNLPFGMGGAPRLGAIVVHADPRSPRIAALLDTQLSASALVRGVRCSATHYSDGRVRSFTEDPHLLANTGFLRGFAAIAERGLSFEAWVLSDQLRDVEILATAYPQTTIVLNHYATPVGALGPVAGAGATARERDDIYKRWADDVAAVAALPNVVAKHSGAGMPLLGTPHPVRGQQVSPTQLRDAIAPYVIHTHRLFGNDRTLWGSNYPIDKPNQSIPTSAWLLFDILGGDLDARKVFQDNAKRTYRLQLEETGA
jgi:L-fuconolactonase